MLDLDTDNEINESTSYSQNCFKLEAYEIHKAFDPYSPSPGRNFSIFYQNIRSYNKNFDDISIYLGDYATKIDLFAFCETWFLEDSCANIFGYNGYHTTRANRSGGGVSIYVNEKFKSSKLTKYSGIFQTFETIVSIVKVNANVELYIICIYRPPNNRIRQFIEDFNEYLANNFSNLNDVIVLGDFNLDMKSNCPLVREFTNNFECLLFNQLIDTPTREHGNSKTIIDHLWSNSNTSITAYVLATDFTDHYTLISHLRITHSNKFIIKRFRNHSEENVRKFVEKFSEYISDEFQTPELNLDNSVLCVVSKIQMLYDECCPIMSKNYSVNRILKPWLTDDVIKLVEFKHFLHKEYKHKYVPHRIYKNFRNNLEIATEKIKLNFIKNKFSTHQGDPSRTWENINKYILRSNKCHEPITLCEDNIIQTDSHKNAESFRKYFSAVAPNLDRNIPTPTSSSFIDYLGPRPGCTFTVNTCHPPEVRKTILSFQNKGCPINEVPVFIYKSIVEPLSLIFSNFFNLSVSLGLFPSCLKNARVVPVFKSGDNTLVQNYRPICIVNFFTKIFEKLMCSRLNRYLISNKLLCDHQFGFRANLSTTDALAEFTDLIYSSLDKNEKFIAIYLDFSKAFDTVNFDILLAKLRHIGIIDNINDWFKSFLGNRMYFVSIDGYVSESYESRLGVPQGAVLAPSLFIIYINDMFRACPNLDVIHYADDTTAFARGKNLAELQQVINQNLNYIDNWLICNRLTLNIQKSSYMIFGGNNDSLDISIRNISLCKVDNIKFLGVIFDKNLNFKLHYEKVLSSLSRISGITYKSRYLLPKNVLKTLYLSLGWSHLSYAIVIWGGSSQTYKNRIIRIQNRIIKNIYGNCLSQTYKINGLLMFSDAFNYFSSLKLYKEINNSTVPYFSERLMDLNPTHPHFTRFSSNLNFVPPRFVKARCHSSFIYLATSFWNTIPTEVKLSQNLMRFKRNIKAYILSLYANDAI